MRISSFILILWTAVALHHPTSASAACSSYVGEATINEVYRLGGTRFIEVKILDPSITASVYNTWSVRVCDSVGCSTYNLNTATVNGSYLVINNVDNIDLRAGATMDAVLYDGLNAAGDAIDYVSVNSAPYQNPPASCLPTSLPYPFSYTNTSSEKKGIYRNPDGTGPWIELEASGGSGEPTEGGDNSTSSLGAFNAYEYASASDPTIGHITTQVSGGPFSLTVVAIKNQAIDTNYRKTVTIELVDAGTGGSCETLGALPNSVQSAAFTAGDNGLKSVTFPETAAPDAWRNIRVRMTEGNTFACSTDNFAIRPATFTVQPSHNDWENPGGNELLSDTNGSGTIIHKAGRPFTLQATAVNALGNNTNNYAGQPDEALVSSCIAVPACPVTTGNLNTGTWSPAVAGSVSSNTATYSEVGSFDLVLRDRTFASVDAGDTPASQRHIASAVQPVGRFVPDHFLLSEDTNPTFLTFNDAACPTRSFTYIGQTFGFATAPVVGVTARNAGGVTTANYAGALWKITGGNVIQTYAATNALDTGMIGTPVVTSTGSGTGTITPDVDDVIAFSRNGTVAPFNADISLTVSVTDEDGVTDSGDALFDGGGTGIVFDSGNEFRFGRLVLHNAFGPEILPLPIPLRAEYYDGVAFIPNAADSCTAYDASVDLNLNTFFPALDAGDTTGSGAGTLVSGLPDPANPMVLSAPGIGNHGSADLSLGIKSWLRFDWDGVDQGGDGILDDDDPTARATFGIYKGNPRMIFVREVY